MSTTTIRLEDDLKARVAAAAEREGKTAHAFILDAIARTSPRADLDQRIDRAVSGQRGIQDAERLRRLVAPLVGVHCIQARSHFAVGETGTGCRARTACSALRSWSRLSPAGSFRSRCASERRAGRTGLPTSRVSRSARPPSSCMPSCARKSRSPDGMNTLSGLRPQVKLELGSLTDQRPTEQHAVRAWIVDDFLTSFPDWHCQVTALELPRTFWKKSTILHAEHQSDSSPMTTAHRWRWLRGKRVRQCRVPQVSNILWK